MILGGSRWSEAACAAMRASPSASPCRCAPRSAALHLFDRAASLLRRRSRHRPQSEAARAHQGAPISCCWSAAGSARCRRRATRCSTFPSPQTKFVHVHPGAEELGRVYRPHLAINAAPTGFRGGARRPAAAERDPLARRDEDRACRLSRLDRDSRPSSRARSISARSWCGCASSLPADSDHLQRRRQFLGLDASLLSLPPLRAPCSAPTSGSMGYGLPAAVGDEAALSRAHGGLRRRRRRLPDERAGIRDRRAIRPADHRADRRQRHVRHHPHASGARISRPRHRRPRCAIRTSPPMRARSAASARRSRRPRISPTPSRPRRRRASRRSST